MAEKIGSEEREASLYRTQIRYLDKELERHQLKCDELKKQNKDLTAQYSALEEDKKDIAEYLRYSACEKEQMVEELTAQLERRQQDREALKLQHSQQMQQLQEQIDKINSETSTQVTMSEEQVKELMQQCSCIESLENQLVRDRSEHVAAVAKVMLEAGLKKKEMFDIMTTVSENVKVMTSGIVQRERAEHSVVLEKFQLQVHENTNLWKVKMSLKDRVSDLGSEICNKMNEINSIDKENFTYKNQVTQLMKKCKQLEMKIERRRITNEHVLAKVEKLRQDVDTVSEEYRQKAAEAIQLEAELKTERSKTEKLEDAMQKAVALLRKNVMVADSEWRNLKLLEMLEILETAPQGQRPQSYAPVGIMPSLLHRAETLTLEKNPLFLLTRYRPGDLGFIPRPMWVLKPAVSSGTRLLHRREPCSQKTSNSITATVEAHQKSALPPLRLKNPKKE